MRYYILRLNFMEKYHKILSKMYKDFSATNSAPKSATKSATKKAQ